MELITPPDEPKATETVGASTAAILKQTLALMRRRKAVLLAGMCIVYALGAVYYASRDFVYEARAAILVHPMGDALSGRNDERTNFMPTHLRLVTSSAVLERAIEKMKLKDKEPEASHDWPSADDLADALKASSQKDTEILEVAYRTKDKITAVPVMEAVVGAYLDFVNETHRSTSRDILQILTQQKDELDKQLRVKETTLLEIQQKEGVMTSTAEERSNVTMARVMAVNDSLTRARVHRLELEARAQSLKAAIARKEPIDAYLIRYLDRMGSDLVASSLGLHQNNQSYMFEQDSIRRAIVADQLELQRLKGTYGPKHPKVLMLEEKIRLTSQSLTPEKMTPQLKAQNQKELQDLALLLIESDIKEANTVEDDLRKQCEVEKAKAVELNARLAPFVALETELNRMRSFYDIVNLRIRQVNLGGDAGVVSTQVIEPPQEPGAPVSPNLQKVILTCSFIGLLFGLALCYLFEWWDTGYRGPEDIVQHMGLQVVGHVPRMTLKEGKPLELIMDHTPRSAEAEAFRTMRTAIMLRDFPPRKFTITSPEPGDGKTLILTNLGIAFAKSGMRVLMIDGDLRRPRLRELFDLPRTGGLAQLLQEREFKEEDLEKAIERSPVANLDVLPSGSNPPNPTELLTGPRFGQILAWADGRYDRILCDAPPILAVSDCALIGRLLDGAFLVIRADKNDRIMAGRARDTLREMNCNVLGVIVNSLFIGDVYGYAYYRKYSYYSRRKYYQTDVGSPKSPSDEGPDPEKKVA